MLSSLSSVMDVPCFTCADLDKCDSTPSVSPKACKKLDMWIDTFSKQ